MKLKELFENEFDNKEHTSTKDEITYLKNHLIALEKEKFILTTGKWTDERNKYYLKYCNRVGNPFANGFRDSTEYQEFQNLPIDIKLGALHNKIIQNKAQILQTTSRDLFDTQKQENINSKLIPNTNTLFTHNVGNLQNPYYSNGTKYKYYGTPQDYPYWNINTLKEYNGLSTYLKSKNLPGFTTMFVGGDVHNTKSIVIGDNRNVIWKFTVSNYGTQTGIVHSSVRVANQVFSTKQFLKQNNIRRRLPV